MGFTQSTQKHYFLSVEEESETYIITNNFEYFNTNEDQILYFILDFLNILNQLKLYRIKLKSQKIIFAVVKSLKTCRFRVDDIGRFCYVDKPKSFENYLFLITVLENLLSFIKDKDTYDFIRDITVEANILRSTTCDNYIESLIQRIEKRFNIN